MDIGRDGVVQVRAVGWVQIMAGIFIGKAEVLQGNGGGLSQPAQAT